jgi:hypothetical protein
MTGNQKLVRPLADMQVRKQRLAKMFVADEYEYEGIHRPRYFDCDWLTKARGALADEYEIYDRETVPQTQPHSLMTSG